MTSRSYPVLVLGLDGATFDLMLPWVAQGDLPNLARLIDEGAHSRLESTTPPITPCAWSSFMTGKNPGKHGLFDFVEPEPGGRGFRFTNASSRHGETIWGALSRHNRRVGVVNVPMTFPPEQVNGYLLSGLDTPHERSGYAYPQDVKGELQGAGIPYRVDLRHLGDMRNDARRDRRIEDLREMESIRTDALQYLRGKYPSDFTMVVYIAVDQVQHHFWHYMDPTHDKYDAEGAKQYGQVIHDMYVHLDTQIGRLLEDAPEDLVTVVMSDHGFGPIRDTRLRLNQAFSDAGLLRFEEAKRGGRLSRSAVRFADRLIRSNLSSGMKSLVAGMFPRLRVWFESQSEAQIDWQHTTAYANEVYRASPAVWLDRKEGATDAELEQDINAAHRVLDELIDPATGSAAISKVVRSADIYHGPFADRAPDLFPSWWEDGFLLEASDPTGTAATAVAHSSDPVTGGTEFAGGHRLDGVFILHGGPTRSGTEFTGAHITDVAPTVLYLMGHPVPDDMDGKPLLDILDPQFVAENPVEYERTSDTEDDAAGESTQPEMSPEDREMVAKRLQALGYID